MLPFDKYIKPADKIILAYVYIHKYLKPRLKSKKTNRRLNVFTIYKSRMSLISIKKG